MTKRAANIDEIRTALEAFEKAAIPGGGGHVESIKACILWEIAWKNYNASLGPKQRVEYKKRAAIAFANAMA